MQLTLTDRLRLAALERAEHGGRVVGTYVIDNDGVIDLRALEDRQPRSRASDLAPLHDMAGRFEDAADVSHLYASEGERSRGWFRRRTREQDAHGFPSSGGGQIQAGDATPAEAPIPGSGPEDARVAPRHLGVPVDEQETEYDHVIDLGKESEPEPDVSIRGQQPEPSILQSAIMDFNQPEVATESAVVDIESGIVFGSSGQLPQPADDVIDQRVEPGTDSGPPSGPVQTPSTPDADLTEGAAAVADPSPPGPPGDRDDQTPAATSGGDAVVCPACGGAATKDFANRFLEIDFFSCNDCFNMWHLAAEDDP